MWWLLKRISIRGAAVVSTFLFFVINVSAAPHEGEQFSLRQPDGTLVPVLVWGDEFHQDVESPDGYTLVRDKDGWICYADLSSDGNEYVSSGIRYTGEKRSVSLKKKVRINRESMHRMQRKNREVLGYEELISSGSSHSPVFSPAPPDDGIEPAEPKEVVGLTILIDFPDQKSNITRETIENFCNQPGYSGNSNNGSVFDYFRDVSNGLMLYTNVVTPFITADNNKTYYDRGENYPYVQELLTNILTKLKNQGFDLSRVSVSNNRVIALNVFYAGSATAGWANGLWPHAGTYRGGVTINGIGFSRYQLASLGSAPRLGTFVHENGHMLMGWADLYSYEDHSNGVGRWCVMNSVNPATNPQQPNPYFRNRAGWITVTDITGAARGTLYTHAANSHSAFTYVRNTKEFYFIEARRRSGRSSGLPGDGLLVWHVHTDGLNTYASKGFPLVALMQADGKRDLENRRNSGDSNDPFRQNGNARFNNSTTPAAVYHDGVASGIDLAEISVAGDTMTFKIGPNAEVVTYTLTVENGSGSGTYSPGEIVSISAPETGTGGAFLRWSSTTLSPQDPYNRSTTLVMGNSNATVTARYANPGVIPGTVQAEQFGYQQDASTATSSDAGGGQYVNFTRAGAFIELLVDVQSGDSTTLSYRISSSAAAVLKLREMRTNTLIDSVSFPGAGFGQNWRTVTGNKIALTTGKQVWRMESSNGSFFLNWFRSERLFTLTVVNGTGSGSYTAGQNVSIEARADEDSFLRWSSSSQSVNNPYSSLTSITMDSADVTVTAHFYPVQVLPGVIEAESAPYMQGITTGGSSDEGGGLNLLIGETGAFAEYLVKASAAGFYNLSFRVASSSGDRLILKDMIKNKSLDTIDVPQTGGTQNWVTVECEYVTLDTAVVVWRIESVSGTCSLNWFAVRPTASLQVINGSGSGDYASGTVVQIQADPPPEQWKYFAGWTGDNASLSAVSNPLQPITTVTIGNFPIIVTATYVDSPTVGIVMPSGTGNAVIVNDTFFYDDGGKYYGYSSNFSGEVTFIPGAAGLKVVMNFEVLDLGDGATDSLLVYAGSGENKALLGTFTGNGIPEQISSNSADGRITVRFISDGSQVGAGWKVHLTAEPILSVKSFGRIPQTFGIASGSNGILNFQLPQSEHVEVKLYDMRGRMVAVLFEGRKLPGYYKLGLSGADGSKLSSGFYAVTMTAGKFRKSVPVNYR